MLAVRSSQMQLNFGQIIMRILLICNIFPKSNLLKIKDKDGYYFLKLKNTHRRSEKYAVGGENISGMGRSGRNHCGKLFSLFPSHLVKHMLLLLPLLHWVTFRPSSELIFNKGRVNFFPHP